MKQITHLLFAAAIFSASSAYAEQPSMPDALSEKFSDILLANPGAYVQVILHMRHEVPLKGISQMFESSSVFVKSLRHRSLAGEGGYGVGEGEALSEVVKNYERDHLHFLEERLNDEQKMLDSIQQPGLRKAILSHIETAKRAKSEHQKKGLQVTHIAVTGSAEAVQDVVRRTPAVSHIEMHP